MNFIEKNFTKKQKNTTEILVLGYPNPGIKGKGPRKLEKWPVVYFATNFLTSVLAAFKKRMHEHQIKEIIELRASLDKRFQKIN